MRHQPVGQQLQAADRRRRGAVVHLLGPQQPLGDGPGADVQAQQGPVDPHRAAHHRRRVQPLPRVRRHPRRRHEGHRGGLRAAARGRGRRVVAHRARAQEPRHRAAAEEPATTRSGSPRTPSCSPRPWASTSSTSSCATSAPSGRSTAARSPPSSATGCCRSSEPWPSTARTGSTGCGWCSVVVVAIAVLTAVARGVHPGRRRAPRRRRPGDRRAGCCSARGRARLLARRRRPARSPPSSPACVPAVGLLAAPGSRPAAADAGSAARPRGPPTRCERDRTASWSSSTRPTARPPCRRLAGRGRLRPRRRRPTPATPCPTSTAYDALLVLGGAMGANDDAEHAGWPGQGAGPRRGRRRRPDARHLPGPPADRGGARRRGRRATRAASRSACSTSAGPPRRPRPAVRRRWPPPRRGVQWNDDVVTGCPTGAVVLAPTPRRRGAGGPVRADGVGRAAAPRGRRAEIIRPWADARPRTHAASAASTRTPCSPRSTRPRDRAATPPGGRSPTGSPTLAADAGDRARR